MASYNRVMLMGNLTRDIDLRYLPSGMAVAEFAIAVNEKRKASDGQWVEDVSFFDITLFGRTAEVAGEYLSKGSPIFVEGRLKQDTWEKDGQKRSKVKVIGERMQMIGGRGNDSGGGRPAPARSSSGGGSQVESQRSNYVNSNTPSPNDSQPTGDGPGYDEPDIPF
ncbi:single-stranded DNA-binding protein [Rhodopirellula sp. JC740]|uniref:Single-stranded DNA-binding protein n=1 Tax=Rhodopirellula halodulae TaxID=2894198 RepID=A0ABS8NDV8_9BACT|nr:MULTISPECIES: single-stranded DNA-binding protein [unclassified Rhodopirellula]MCC9641729.1 single-stranded DNA-binding protein [Rhodopirellula sp. JC740]MCC9654721.1 single-stranded DNA-binding protein [Rhodopirellula sp. JC737]